MSDDELLANPVGTLTRLSNTDSHIPPSELLATAVESGDETLPSAELDISEALGAVVVLVTDESHVSDIAAGEEIGDLGLGGIERKIADVRGIRRLVRDGELMAAGLIGFLKSERWLGGQGNGTSPLE